MNKINYAICGSSGYWSQNIKKTLDKLGFPLIRTCDLVGNGFDNIPHSDNLKDILDDDNINAVIIATPPSSHHSIAKQCIKHNKHIWCEKPTTLSVKEADDLLLDIQGKNLIFHSDNTFTYDSSYWFIKNGLKLSFFGKPSVANMTWVSSGKWQPCGIYHDLAPHLISQLFGWWGCPSYLSATATRKNDIAEHAQIIFTYRDELKVYCELSWISPRKIRQTQILTDKGALGTFYNNQVMFCTRDGLDKVYNMPEIGTPLEVELTHFNQCILEGKKTLSNLSESARIVEICEKLEKSSLEGGREIKL